MLKEHDSNGPAEGPLAAYRALLEVGDLRPDPAQAEAAEKLEALHKALHRALALRAEGGGAARGLLARFFGNGGGGNGRNGAGPRGLYIHGGVGRGKSMLMDLFFEGAPVAAKRRVHFHEFMLECHARIHRWRKMSRDERSQVPGAGDLEDPIPPLAAHIATGARLLCFDEFQVSDVADAMILARLFRALFGLGVTVVATSNRAPETLYEGGLNRELFLPFIDLIRAEMDVLHLDGGTDYRLERLKGLDTYHVPVNEETTRKLKEAFWRLTDRDVGDPATVPSEEIEVQGRRLFVPKVSKGAAVFSFKRLCADPKMPLGAADYLAIAWRYHTVFVVAIPRMGREQRNEAKRFVTLIDALYDNNVKLICSAAARPEDLYPAGDGAFEFERTVSRLIEMQSAGYLARGHAV